MLAFLKNMIEQCHLAADLNCLTLALYSLSLATFESDSKDFNFVTRAFCSESSFSSGSIMTLKYKSPDFPLDAIPQF